MKQLTLSLIFCALSAAACAAGAPAGRDYAFAMDDGCDSMRVRIAFHSPASGLMEIYPESTNDVIRVKMWPVGQRDDHVWGISQGKAKGKVDVYPDCGLRLDVSTKLKKTYIGFFKVWWGYDFVYWFMPFFDKSRGLYDHKQVTAGLERWKRDYAPFAEREVEFDFQYDASRNRTSVWMDRQFAGRLAYSGKIRKITLSLKAKAPAKEGDEEPAMPEDPTVTCESYAAHPTRAAFLPAIAGHTSDFLREGAELIFDRKLPEIEGKPFEVWPAARSCDSGLHIRTQHPRSFGSDPYYNRSPWQGGPEYMHWTVPSAFYSEVFVLCADVPGTNTVPVLGTVLARYGNAVNQENVATCFTDLSAEVAKTNADVQVVGTLKYVRDGKPAETPLYLVRQRPDLGRMIHVLQDKTIYTLNEKTGVRGQLPRFQRESGSYLDFELIGAKDQKARRSSIQVFGCVLRPTPYTVEIVESERGNIFEEPEKPETSVEVKASEDNVKGTVDWTILDDDFRVLKSGTMPFALAKKGEKKLLTVDLAMPEVGWYMLDYVFRDAKGTALMTHHAAFTLLGVNDREAGFESPYACWPQGTAYTYNKDKGGWGFWNLGKSNCNPNRAEVAKLMHKAGYHSAWSVPAVDEDEFPQYQITQSAFAAYCNHKWPTNMRYTEKDLAEISNKLDHAVEHYRKEMKRYPHCKTIQILHEQGGKTISQELMSKVKREDRKPYQGLNGPHLAVWATESAKRYGREFPGYHLQLGNGSSSCELIGSLLRNGFDLDLVDTLGIESKGFQTMPELCRELEAPGMLWALKETAAFYGYSNKLVNACNEYVFRPERPADVSRRNSHDWRMRVTNYVLRDYLISLAHGCWTISFGHLEDCDEAYYNTNWGASGQCTFYPFSYPKRVFTALANLTKVLDKATCTRCLDVRGANAVYAVEFRRDRKTKDYATALWSASAHGKVALAYPSGAKVRAVDWQGRSRELTAPKDGRLEFAVGPTPFYLVCREAALSAEYLGMAPQKLPENTTLVTHVTTNTAIVISNNRRGEWCPEGRAVANYAMKTVADDERGGDVAEFVLDRAWSQPVSDVIEEECKIWFLPHKVKKLDPRDFDEIGVWVKGNGSFGRVLLEIHTSQGLIRVNGFPDRAFVCFDGWRLLRAKMPKIRPDKSGKTWFAPAAFYFTTYRKALNPRDMVPVDTNLRVGDVIGIRTGAPPPTAPKEKAYDAMDFVGEKDL